MRNQGVGPADEVEVYLVNLLSAYCTTKPARRAARHEARVTAQGARSPKIASRALRDVGDTTLYLSGFFAESLQRKLVDVDYYITIGGSAYGQLARAYERKRAGCTEVYDELGNHFGDYVEVLAEVSQGHELRSGAPTSVVGSSTSAGSRRARSGPSAGCARTASCRSTNW